MKHAAPAVTSENAARCVRDTRSLRRVALQRGPSPMSTETRDDGCGLPIDRIRAAEAAGLLGYRPSTAWRLIQSGELPGWRVGSKLWLSRLGVLGHIERPRGA